MDSSSHRAGGEELDQAEGDAGEEERGPQRPDEGSLGSQPGHQPGQDIIGDFEARD